MTGVALIAGLAACTSPREAAPVAQRVEERPVEPLPSPNLEPELATTVRGAEPSPAQEEPAPEAPSYEPTLDTRGSVRVRRLVVATGIRDHEPNGAADVFQVDAQRRIYAFVDAVNDTGERAALEVTFEPEEGESTGHVALEVPAGARRWRTWAYTRHVYTPGRWLAVVRAPDGQVIASRPFDVEE